MLRYQYLLRCLHFFVAYHDIALRAVHIPGVLNIAADAISRNYMQVLRQAVPSAEWQLNTVPLELWDLLVLRQPNWRLVDWKQLLRSFVRRV